jgi:hypothetical protein
MKDALPDVRKPAGRGGSGGRLPGLPAADADEELSLRACPLPLLRLSQLGPRGSIYGRERGGSHDQDSQGFRERPQR